MKCSQLSIFLLEKNKFEMTAVVLTFIDAEHLRTKLETFFYLWGGGGHGVVSLFIRVNLNALRDPGSKLSGGNF